MPTATQTHTPGPWRVTIEYRAPSVDDVDIVSDYAQVIVASVGQNSDAGAANAHLIAAAPDLLSALKAFEAAENQIDDAYYAAIDHAHELAHAAIAHAEGR